MDERRYNFHRFNRESNSPYQSAPSISIEFIDIMPDSEFNPSQRAVLASICDTFFPQLSDEDTDDIVKADKAYFSKEVAKDYTEERKLLVIQWCKRKATDVGTDIKVMESVVKNIPSDVIIQTKLLLSALSTSFGTLALSMASTFRLLQNSHWTRG